MPFDAAPPAPATALRPQPLWVPRRVLATPAALSWPHGAAVAERAAALGAEVVRLKSDRLSGCGCGGGDFAEEVRPMLRERGLDAERDGMAAVLEPTSSAGSRRASGTTPRWTGFPPAHRPRGDDLPRHPRGALHAAA